MKRLFFLAIIAMISIPFCSLFAQLNEEDPESNEINYVTLNKEKSKEYLDTLKSVIKKITDLPDNKKLDLHEKSKIMGTNGKIVDDKLYIITVDDKSDLDGGNSTISQIVFYVMKNDQDKEYFPRENITFMYNHEQKKGIAIWVETYSKNDTETHNKSGAQIKARTDELMKKINELFF